MSDSPATPTDFAAWIGAVTGCAALAFEMWKYKREGARIQLSVGRDMTIGNGYPGDEVALITATNAGDADTTITHVYMEQSNTRLGRLGKKWFRWKWKMAIFGPNPPRFIYPSVLGPGKQWTGMIPEQLMYEVCSDWKYNYLCVLTATKKRPVRVRIHPLPASK